MSLVPTVRTSCTEIELCQSLIKTWLKKYNTDPKKSSIGVIIAQHQLETGSNSQSCWNFNVANIKYSTSAGDVDYCALKGVWEIVNGKRVELTPDDPGSWFRSFPTLDDGVEFYVNFVSGKRYKHAWSAVEAGDPASFSHLLHEAGYYTASEEQYTSAVNSFFNKFMKEQYFEQAMNSLNVFTEAKNEDQTKPDSTNDNKIRMFISSDPGGTGFLATIFSMLKKLFSKS